MAKKRVVKRRRKPASYMMVIRVRVPAKDAKDLKPYRVLGFKPGSEIIHDLEILNAYYDRPGLPNAMPD